MNTKFLNVAIAMFRISDLQNNTAYITVRYADKISTQNLTCVARHQPTAEGNIRKASIPLFYILQEKKNSVCCHDLSPYVIS